jgi:hypothetical protein
VLDWYTNPGTTSLPIDARLSSLAKSPQDWFQAGQKIVIGPGRNNQEFDTIAKLTPFTLSQPLAKNHVRGELVSVVPPAG